MEAKKTYKPVAAPESLSRIGEVVAELIDDHGRLRTEWLAEHDWVVVPVEGDSEDDQALQKLAASVARDLRQSCFISSLPPGARHLDHHKKPLSVCYQAPVSERGLLDAAWEWVPGMEYVITTEEFRFAVVNAEESWHLVAGPKSIVEKLLARPVRDAWCRFGREDPPFDCAERVAIRAHLRRYAGFGMDENAPIFTDDEETA